jgi:branched-chain amino acid transport system substrate-binding protein
VAILVLPVITAGVANARDKVLRISFASNFTGNFAPFGLRLWRGATLAVEEINKSGGIRGQKLELYQVDARSETASLIAE